MTDPLPYDQQRAVLAAGFALGLLDQSEQDEALRLFDEDADFADRVAQWDVEIAAWHAEQPDSAAPPAELWNRIAASTGQKVGPAAALMRPVHVSSGWRITALAASLAAVVFASLWVTTPNRQNNVRVVHTVVAPLTQLSVAQVHSAGDQRLVAVVYDRATGRLLARLSPLNTKGGVPELWLIGSDGKPRSLGTSRSRGEVSIILPLETRRLFADGATIAISLEPSAATKHDAPQGPILGSAKISEI